MIPGTLRRRQPSAWQRELARAVTDPEELVALLGLDSRLLESAKLAATQFSLRVPRGYVARMRRGDPNDPLLRQILPLAAESVTVPGFLNDPVGDLGSMRVPGLLQKYRGRVLVMTTGACAVHCRYCFRRHFPYTQANAAADGWRETLAILSADASAAEVILSGGDPLTLSDARIAALVEALTRIPHVQRLRVHTRLPIVLPERVTDELCALLTGTRLQSIVVVHANHPHEIDDQVAGALKRLQRGVTLLLNQSVLLRGVNDNADVLCRLSEVLFANGALPYYLHLLDKVHGASHFEVDAAAGQALWDLMAARLPGYLVPRLVREEPGAPAKTVIR